MSDFSVLSPPIAAIVVILLVGSGARAEICKSGSYLYDMIDTSGVVSDRMTAVLRRISPLTREIIGGAIPGGSTGNLREGSWIATFQAAGVSFSVSKYSSPDSNYRKDVTVFFRDGYATQTKFDLLALSNVNGNSIEYDLLRKFEPPPEQVLLTFANFRETYTHVLETSLFADPSGDNARAADKQNAEFLALLKASSGAWALVGCYEN